MAGESNGCKQAPFGAAQTLALDELVGRKIRLRRTVLDIAVEELAQTVGVSPLQLQAFESGKARVDPQRLADIAKALGVSVTWFFIRTDD